MCTNPELLKGEELGDRGKYINLSHNQIISQESLGITGKYYRNLQLQKVAVNPDKRKGQVSYG